jgi:hypothetical protein
MSVDFLDANDKLLKTYVFENIRDYSKSKFQRTFRIIQIKIYANRYGINLNLAEESSDDSNIDVGILAKVISMMSNRYGLNQDQYEILYDAPRAGE